MTEKMCSPLRALEFTLLLGCFVVATTAQSEDKPLDNVLQRKTIHIVDVKGNMGAMEINATYKDIKLLNISGNANETLLENLMGTGLIRPVSEQSRPTDDLIAIIEDLKAQVHNLNATVSYLKSLSSTRSVERKQPASTCPALDSSSSVQLISLPVYPPFRALCAACGAGPGWIVIQQRFDGSISFYRDWNTYRNGFGYYEGEFFMGLEYIYRLTKSRPYELYVELIDFDNHMFYARYDSFLIGSEEEQYMLKSLGTYSGNAGDSLKYNLFDKFSTYDKDNDRWPRGNCANYYESGWWFNWDANSNYCAYLTSNSNLNGRYLKSGEKNIKGIWWYTLKGYYSLKSVRMLIRPKYTLL